MCGGLVGEKRERIYARRGGVGVVREERRFRVKWIEGV